MKFFSPINKCHSYIYKKNDEKEPRNYDSFFLLNKLLKKLKNKLSELMDTLNQVRLMNK